MREVERGYKPIGGKPFKPEGPYPSPSPYPALRPVRGI